MRGSNDARILDFNHRHLGGRMDHRAALILAASLFFAAGAQATYLDLMPPPGWSYGGEAVGKFNVPAPTAGYTQVLDGNFKTVATYDPAGRRVPIPAKLPLVPQAAKRVAAMAVFAHPVLRTAVAVATWLGAAQLVYDVADGLWKQVDPSAIPSDGYRYTLEGVSSDSIDYVCLAGGEVFVKGQGGGRTFVSASPAGKPGAYTCNVTFYHPGTQSNVVSNRPVVAVRNSCSVGWYVTPGGCVQDPPKRAVTQDDFVRLLEPDPRVDVSDLPNVVWPASWPVSAPKIEPTFVPVGNPVPNPNYDPSKPPSTTNQPYNQPGVKIDPAPTAQRPWQVDVRPVNRPVDSPTAKPEPSPEVNPDGSTKPDPGDKPREDKPDLCEKHPDIVACQKLEEPEDPGELKKKEVQLDFQIQSGYAGAAVCPAPIVVSTWHSTLSFSWQPFCNQLELVKNLLLASAWLIAAWTLLRTGK